MKPSKAASGPSPAAVGSPFAIRRLARECRAAGADPKCPASASTLLAEAATALDAYAMASAMASRGQARPKTRDGGRFE